MTPPKPEAREFHWVPEDAMFECASDCLGKYPDMGPACLVANHSAYEELKAENEKLIKRIKALRKALEKISDPTKMDHKEPDLYSKYGCLINVAYETLIADDKASE